MRFGLLIAIGTLLATACAQGASAQGARGQAPRECVSPREMPEIVAASGVVAPAAAIMTARRQVPNADVVRANLCWSERVLVYVIVALRRDGRVVHVLIDGPSGQVKSVQ